jgi:hypothetical protein
MGYIIVEVTEKIIKERVQNVTDLALQAYQLLRQDLQELINEMEEVEPWNGGEASHVVQFST